MTNLKIEKAQSSEDIIAYYLPTLLAAIKEKSFVDGYEATDEEALGLVVSKFCKWDALSITQVAAEAYEDANFDDLAHTVKTNWAMNKLDHLDGGL
tara:strand:+ start:1830 stop:2117 length:288 start_codon:yes stop_codon:yes gene_type:complete